MLAFSFVLILAGCNNSKQSSAGKNEKRSADGKVEIEFWTMQLQPTFTDYMNGVIADYEKENPNVKIKWVDIPWDDMEKKILSAVASNTAPDVVNLNTQFASQLAELDALVDMDEAVPAEIREKYFEGIWNSNSFGGKVFGIPWYLSSQVAMYNKDIFKEAGLSEEEVPRTFEEVQKIAKKIKEKTGKYAFFPPLDGSHLLETLVMMGVDLTDEKETKAAFNTEKGKKAFQLFVDMYQDELIPREVLTEGHGKAIDMYQAGEIALFSSGPQFLDKIEENAPDIFKATGIGPFVTGETGLKNVAAMNLVVPKQSKHQEEAIDFSLFITNAENQVAFDKITSILPSIETALDDPYFSEMPANPTIQDEARLISANQLKDSKVLVPPMKNYPDLQKSMNEAIQAAMLGEKSVAEALDVAEKEWNEILKKK